MGLLTKEVEVTLNGKLIRYFENLGYSILKYTNKYGKEIVKRRTIISVKVEDLPDFSKVLVDVKCDCCNEEIKNVKWLNYVKSFKKYNKYCCIKCAKNKQKKWISFYIWCYDNLSKEEADNIIERWDYSLNIKNGKILSPKDVSFSSNGFNKKGYWFKCLDHSEHKSELKSISRFTYEFKGFMGSINCNQCNVIALTHPELVKYLVNKEDAYKYSYGSNKNISMKCPDCGFKKEIAIPTLLKVGFGCNRCSDGVSYPQKFMFNILEQLNLIFLPELNKTTFKWCNGYKYDFYINKINGICEVHGIQHYEENRIWKLSLKEVKENDKLKEQLAKVNKINNYIVIDCRYSQLEWIKDNIMQSELPILLNFKEEDIDWLKAHEAGCSNNIKMACVLWNNNKNINIIADKLKLNRATIIRYLKKGALLRWCDYDHKIGRRKKVICLTTGEIFDSIVDAKNKYNVNRSSIPKCCEKERNYAGKLPDGTKLKWEYYNG